MTGARPAPELAAAMRESRIRGEIILRLAGTFSAPDGRRMRHATVTAATLDRWLADAGLPSNGQPASPDLAGQVRALRDLLTVVLDDFEHTIRLELTPERRAVLAGYRITGGIA